jgi:hypothetical protein
MADTFLPNLMFGAVLAQVLLTFVLMTMMGRRRVRFLRESKTPFSAMALGERVYPAEVQKAANAFHNQLELPILFYAACLFALQYGAIDRVFVALAWAFVTLRVVHAIEHAGRNHVRIRAQIFALGALALCLMWGWLAFRVFA